MQKTRENESKFEGGENKFKQVIEGLHDYAIFTLDAKGNIDFWCPGAERMNGYSSAEAIGRHFSILYPEEAVKINEPNNHLKIAETEGRFRGEGLRKRKNGELFMADVYIAPLKVDNKVIGFSKVVQDLSEHNKLIQERDISRTEVLNLKVENELRETFIASLSHDLRNPLSIAKISAQLILRHPIDYESHLKLASKIVDNVNRIDTMIVNLLDAKRITAGGKLVIRKSKCDLFQIISDVTDEVSLIYGKNIFIKYEAPIRGYWDCDGIKRVVENLVTNAVKYGDIECPITVSAELEQDIVLIKVHNFGKVIELPDQLLLFDKFHRNKAAVAGSASGWGLGLTLVKGIVEAHKGNIKVQSLEKEGTTFIVELPLETDET